MQLIVLGMHRSGTSSVTRLLNLAGAYFGPEGIATEANDENPKGFWERRDVRAVCDGLLHGGGFDWWQVADLDLERIDADVREQQLAAFRRIVLEMDAHRPWVMKEPRLSLLLPILRPELEAPVFVHVVREPLEIAESLHSRNGFPVPVGLALWELYTRHGLAATADEPRVHVTYGDLMADPVGTTSALVEALTTLGVPALRMPSEREITGFITPSLHRQRESAGGRAGHLNLAQSELATLLDQPSRDAEVDVAVSSGALATLRAFEATQAVSEELRQARLDAVAERARLADEHRLLVNDLRSAQRAAEEELREQQRAQADELKAVINDRRAAQARAAGAVGDATRRIEAVRASGAFRLGARVSRLRERLRGGGSRGVEVALQGALTQLAEARRELEGQAPSNATDPPPPVEELQEARRAARAAGGPPKVAVLAWDAGHNPFGRAHLLADLLRGRYEVELWAPQFERYGRDLWAPLRDTSLPVHRFPGTSFPDFLDLLDDASARIDADVLYVSKPRLPSLALGQLAKERWSRPLLVDIDDFEPAFFDETEGLRPEDLLRLRDDPDLLLPFGRLWTRACEAAVGAADQITVSNPELEARYGGLVVPHARDEAVFDPERFDRTSARRRLGLADDDRLVLFGGTPRAHKGIVELLRALEELGDEHVRAGVFATRELEELREQIGPLARWILPLPVHSFTDLPGLLAAADVSCALQATDHPVSQHQMPAKVTDAMAMAVPCLVTAVPPLQPLIDKDVVEVVSADQPLHERLGAILHDRATSTDRALRAREVFLESYSYSAVRPQVADVIDRLLEHTPSPAPALSNLVTTVRHVVSGGPAPLVRPPVPAGATYDLAVFWKQNDTGIYGRRQDMFLKYLERSGRFGRIVHFDQPMSVEGLASLAKRSLRSSDQNRLVVAQTVRRAGRRADSTTVRRRTFLYAAGRASKALRLPTRNGYPRWVRSVLDEEGFGDRPLLCWVYPTNPFLPEVLDLLQPDVVVADVVDDNRTWYDPGTDMHERLERNYAAILGRSDVVLANCEPVAESMRELGSDVAVVPNACELPDGRPLGARPASLHGISGPIIGYAGNLSDRIDIGLLRDLARRRRDWTFVLLGSAHRDQSALDLAAEPNVRFLGTMQYEAAQDVIRHFDVALIPHLDNEMTRSMNPLKAFVYCSLGVPIVSTAVANLDELAEYLTIAEGTEGFVTAIEGALTSGRRHPDPDALRPHSWEVRVEQVLDLVDRVASSRPEPTDG